jgi:hypothetical protein
MSDDEESLPVRAEVVRKRAVGESLTALEYFILDHEPSEGTLGWRAALEAAISEREEAALDWYRDSFDPPVDW